MTGTRRSAAELRREFFFHLCVFLAVNLALVIMTVALGGEFWWHPFTMVWGLGVTIEGGLAYMLGHSGADYHGLAYWLRIGMVGITRPGRSTTAHGSPSPTG